ncbi:hypothetical protein [Candidatus Spongiihabitans sp.]|uniref:hypothetical protein n=1 Tax=Candidatus Spongiihabitans sp. TaxID=3101308 RepID=UPI003C7B0D50
MTANRATHLIRVRLTDESCSGVRQVRGAKGKAPVFGKLKRGPIPVNGANIEAMLDSIDAMAASPAV